MAVTNSRYYADVFERLGVPGVEVVYPTPDMSFFSRERLSGDDYNEIKRMKSYYGLNDKTVVIHWGRVDFQKGQIDTIDAAGVMKRAGEMDNVVFVIIGPASSSEELERLWNRAFVVHGLQEGKDVIFVGRQDHEQIRRWLVIADIALYPSRWVEPFGLVSVEAQRMGVPVIVSDKGGLPETVRDGYTGLVVSAKDADALADAIKILVSTLGRWICRRNTKRSVQE